MTDNELDKALELACEGPPVKFGGILSDAAGRLTDVARITKTVVGELKVAGLSAGQILAVLVMIGTFIQEHGDDIQAIVKAVLALFGK